MSRDVITIGSTMRIPLLYRGEYSQWRERFMNYLEEQTDGEAMINSIHNEKKTQKINRLAISLLIQGLPNDIYSLIDSNETAKDLWDALERQMRGSEYSEQDRKAAVGSTMRIPLLYRGEYSQWRERKAAILYEYKTFKANEGEQLLDTYLRYLQVINDLKKCGYKKDNYELNYKFLNNLQPEWKQYGTLMKQIKNLMDINIDALYKILKQNQGDVNDALGYKKKAVVITSDPLALVAEKTKVSKRKEKVVVSSDSERSGADDFSELKKITSLLAKAFNRRKFYSKPTNNNLRTSSTSQSANKKQEFIKSDDKKVEKKVDEKKRDMSKTKTLLAKKDSDEQVLLAEEQPWMESNSDSDQEINANMVFMAQIKKVLSESDESFSSAEETIAEVAYYTSESESESEFKTSKYYDNYTNYGLFVNNDDDQEIFHDAIESASENFIENHIDSQKDYDKSEVDHNDSEEKEHLVDKDKMSRDVITVGSTMRIPLLYRGEYSQWRERFMNYLEEQTNGEAMINYIQNGDQPLPIIAQVSLVGNAQNAPPTLKDPNNETAKDLWDALERQMHGSEYGEQDRKAAILYEYETFKANEGEQLLDTYLRYLQKEGHFAKDYNYYKTKMLLAKKDSDEQVILAEDQAWMESSSDSDQEINANMVFMAQIKK
nr:hypothetical protein [Tanacetum cinerariifolium]